MTARLAFTASLALACGGRESHSTQREPNEPESTGTSSPASEPAESAGDAPLAAMSTTGSVANGCSRDFADYIIEGSREACSARELPECGAGTQPFADQCGCGCTGVPVLSRECRADCRIQRNCPAQHFEDFPDLASTLGTWQQELKTSLDYSDGGWLVEGLCAGGHRFIYRSNHFIWEASLFTSGGAFLSTGSHGDESGEPCSGSYFPEPTRCDAGSVTRVWVQDQYTPYKVGDSVTLP